MRWTWIVRAARVEVPPAWLSWMLLASSWGGVVLVMYVAERGPDPIAIGWLFVATCARSAAAYVAGYRLWCAEPAAARRAVVVYGWLAAAHAWFVVAALHGWCGAIAAWALAAALSLWPALVVRDVVGRGARAERGEVRDPDSVVPRARARATRGERRRAGPGPRGVAPSGARIAHLPGAAGRRWYPPPAGVR
jgi:hypothetical protein